VLAAERLGDRCGLVEGDFFTEVPAGGDAYLLKYILHDRDDGHAITILATCRRAIRPDGRLLLVETVVPGPDETHFAKLQDLEMLVLFASRERTEEDYGQMLSRSGFQLERVVRTVQPVSVMEAVPI
jgi:O-methyltransferase domain